MQMRKKEVEDIEPSNEGKKKQIVKRREVRREKTSERIRPIHLPLFLNATSTGGDEKMSEFAAPTTQSTSTTSL